MVFLRPVVMRDIESATKLSLDRYDLIRARQKEAQPVPSAILGNNETPQLPPYVPSLPAAPLPTATPPGIPPRPPQSQPTN
jgi:general secretion pathway protein D